LPAHQGECPISESIPSTRIKHRIRDNLTGHTLVLGAPSRDMWRLRTDRRSCASASVQSTPITMPGDRTSSLVHDILLPVLEILQYNYGDLYRCALVNRDFNAIASKVLYSRVVLSPPFRPVLNLKDRDGLLVSMSNILSVSMLKLMSLGMRPICVIMSF
jgi:hypothetical protein